MRRFRCMSLLGILFCWSSAASAVTAQLAPSRTSGIAPLAVFFDAAASSASGADPIHDLHYEWDFGDGGSGTWAQSGQPKNTATGPWAAHVFEAGGTYTVRVTVTAPDGSSQQRTTTVNVSDADSFYAGTRTVCVSASGNFAGCPSGAGRVTESNFNVGASHRGQNKRVLFRRGDAFSTRSPLGINQPGPGTLGAYGVGAAPRVQSSQAGPVIRLSGKTPQLNDWRIMDLDFRGPGTRYSSAISSEGTSKQVLLYRLSADDYHTAASFPSSVIIYHNQPELNDEIAFYECSFTDMQGGKGGNGVYLSVNRLMMLGTSIVDSSLAEHVARIQYVGGGVISHNYLSTPAVGKSVVKLHAMTMGRTNSLSEQDSHHFILSHNIFQGGDNNWSVNLGPQNNLTDERVRDAIVEKNYFLAGAGTRIHLNLWASGISARSNVFNMNGGSRHVAISIGQRGIEPPPRDNRAYNNTCYTSDAASSTSCAGAKATASNTTAVNNLLYAPQAGAGSVALASSGMVRDNLRATQNPFVSSSPSSPADFRLKQNGQAVDAGGPIAFLGSDFAGGKRPTDGDGNGAVQWDVGAFELGGGGGSIPPTPTSPVAPFLLP